MTWWVGAYIEAGMGVSGSNATPYMPFVLQAADKATAEKNAGAKLLAGPFTTQGAAQNWADAYEKNPNTVHAGSDLPKSPGNPVPDSSGNNGAGTVKGDSPPVSAGSLPALINLLQNLDSKNLWIRVIKAVLGGTLLIAGVMRMSGTSQAAGKVARLGAW